MASTSGSAGFARRGFAVICNLIANIVNNVAGVSVAESVGSEADAIEAVNHGNVDVVILDLQLRNGTGSASCGRCARWRSSPLSSC
jgi:CheY-like chemotaxis protein